MTNRNKLLSALKLTIVFCVIGIAVVHLFFTETEIIAIPALLAVIFLCGLGISFLQISAPIKSNNEIERRFLVKQAPSLNNGHTVIHISQGWLISTKDSSVRIRLSVQKDSSECVLAVKTGSGLSRRETEMEIPQEQFDALWPQTIRSLKKVRILIPLPDGNTAEYDVFSGPLAGLELVEVEFASEKDALAFVPPAWFGREVTEDSRYVNAVLAENGDIPAEESESK